MPKAHREPGVLSKNGQNRAYAGAWIETDRVAARFGCAAAAISVTRLGAQPSAPTRREIDALLATGKGRP